MSEFKHFTRGDSSPQGKPRVYFTAHPDDYAPYFETIREEILSRQNCAVFYLEPGVDSSAVDDYELRLSQMQLFTVPVTTKLLTTPNREMDVEIPFALSHHIPVLPLMQEGGLDELFNRRFGDLQYLDKNNTDPTAIPYDEKLTKYLSGVLVGDELAAKVRAAFDAYIFLSYRKKDRRYAQELMRLIHKVPFSRNIAVWYDEFLTPGEDFNDAIRAALEDSELFMLNVTPNIVNEANYVQSTEYPMARDMRKSIIPVETVPTDRNQLRDQYEGLPEPVSVYCGADNKPYIAACPEMLEEMLHEELRALGIPITAFSTDPLHNYYTGLAYLSGIDVEVDHARAVELITGSAEAGCTEAIEKLISMYETGEGLQRDYYKAVEWRERLIKVRKKEYDEAPNEDKALDLLDAIRDCGEAYHALEQMQKAYEQYSEMLACSERFLALYGTSALKRYVSASYIRIGDITLETRLEPRRTIEAYRKSFEIREALVRESRTAEALRDLLESYERLGKVTEVTGDPEKEEEYYRKSLLSRELLVWQTGTAEDRRSLIASYINLGDIVLLKGDLKGAEEYYRKGLKISEDLARETGSVQARRNLALCYEKLGEVASKNSDLRGAEDYYRKCNEIREELARETGTVEARRDLIESYIKLGEIAQASGDLGKAEEYYSKSLEIRDALDREIGTTECRDDLALSYYKLGKALNKSEYFLKAQEIWREMLDKRPGEPVLRIRYEIAARALARSQAGASTDPKKKKRSLFDRFRKNK